MLNYYKSRTFDSKHNPSSAPEFKTFSRLYPGASKEELITKISITLTEFRNRFFLTQEDLSKQLGVTSRGYQSWENGEVLMRSSVQSSVRRFIHQKGISTRCASSSLIELRETHGVSVQFFEDVYAAIFHGHYDVANARIEALEKTKEFYQIFPEGHDIWIRNKLFKAINLAVKGKCYNENHELECIDILDKCIDMGPQDPGLYAAIHTERIYYDFIVAKEKKKSGDKEWRKIADKLVDDCRIVEDQAPDLSEPLWNRANVASLLESSSQCKEVWDDILKFPHIDQKKEISARRKKERVLNSKNLYYLSKTCNLFP